LIVGRSARALIVSVATAIAGLVALDIAFSHHAKDHIIAEVTLRQAEASGDGCVLLLGDSLMVYGIDLEALAGSLRAGGAEACLAHLAIRATWLPGQTIAFRRYLADGRTPRVVVLGSSPSALLAQLAPTEPNDILGNSPHELAWSRASDVKLYYPEFPPGDLDRGIRYSLARLTALQTYESATWSILHQFELRYIETKEQPVASEGASPESELLVPQRALAKRLFASSDGHWRPNPWAPVLWDLARSNGTRVVVVDMPICSMYRREILDAPTGQRATAWFKSEVARAGAEYLDMRTVVPDDGFNDGAHCNPQGAREFSRELGRRLAPIVIATAR
jgi:hypothetical protein